MIAILGAFDGFHRGHARLLERGRALAREEALRGGDGKWCVVTFSPHPANVISGKSIPVLFTENERDALSRALAIPETVKIPFSRDLANLSSAAFLEYLERLLPVSGIVVGQDFRFGRNREGDTSFLRKYAEKKKWLFQDVEPFTMGGKKVGSSGIRNLVAHGDAAGARNMLGYPYFFEGEVVPGDGRGRKLGFPTANVRYPGGKVLPRRGVYAVSVLVRSGWHPGALNIGYNPTFPAERDLRAETYIIGFQGDLYGVPIAVFLEKFLREELKFDSLPALISQMEKDVENSRIVSLASMEHEPRLYEDLLSAFCPSSRHPL